MSEQQSLGGADKTAALPKLLETVAEAKRRIADLNGSIAVELDQLKAMQKDGERAIAELLAESGGDSFSVPGVAKAKVSHSVKYSIDDSSAFFRAAALMPALYDAVSVTLKPAEIANACATTGVPVETLIENGAIKTFNAQRVTVTPARK